MVAFSPTDAALNAFQKRSRRFVLARATIVYLLLRLVLGALFFALTWQSWSAILDWYGQAMRSISTGAGPSQPPLDAFFAVLPWGLLTGLAGLILFAAFEAACLRWIVRGETGGALTLDFSADTWRVFAIYWIWFGLAIAGVIAIVCFYGALRVLSSLHDVMSVVALLIGALAPLGLIALCVFCAVRLAPAAALSVARRKLTFFAAWPATRGVFWPLLGGYVIVFVCYLVVALIADALLQLPFAAAIGPAWQNLILGDGDAGAFVETVMQTFTQPLYIALGVLYVVVTMALACVFYVAWFGVAARAVSVAKGQA